ncbi:MAG: PRTRC system protein D [Methylovulum sp.]|nr:PRTRC system protein D [Methylovulum sp.]
MIVRAIDVGYGNTKFCYGKQENGVIRCGHFPSVATQLLKSEIGAGVMAKRDTVEVLSSDGTLYIVGVDAIDTLSGQDDAGRILGSDYINTPQHLAFFRGALHYLDEPDIDLLVTGLPVDYFSGYKDRMAATLKGLHVFPDDRTVNVKEVWVVPQPVGGFIDYTMSAKRFAELVDSKCLIIDIGWFTVDFLVCCGLKLEDNRCGSTAGGMSQILKNLAALVSQDIHEKFDNINQLDKGIRNGFQMRLYGKPYDFSHLMPKVSSQIQTTLRVVLNSVGSLQDIDLIVLVGGGAECFRPEIDKLFDPVERVVATEGIYANTRGFYRAGEERVKKYGR